MGGAAQHYHLTEITVTEFVCHREVCVPDHAGQCIDIACTCKFMAAGRDYPTAIEFRIQTDKDGSSKLNVVSDSRQIYPACGVQAYAKLEEDFVHRWNFRGTARNLNEQNAYEVRIPAESTKHPEQWSLATLQQQNEDGTFEVVAIVHDCDSSTREASLPAVACKDIRHARTRTALQIPQRSLVLFVPQCDPTRANLSVDGCESIANFFARRTPLGIEPSAAVARVLLQVSRDRSEVTANAGHTVLSHFVSGEVRRIDSQCKKLKSAWRIQIGPCAEHTIEVEKAQLSGKSFLLSIDEKRLVECGAKDLECCDGDPWRCDFRFVGERLMDFEVFDTTHDGVVLDSKTLTSQLLRSMRSCSVVVPDPGDLTSATLTVDGLDFQQLPPLVEAFGELNVVASPEVLQHDYGLEIPNAAQKCVAGTGKEVESIPSMLGTVQLQSMARMITSFTSSWVKGVVTFDGAWGCCCTAPQVAVSRPDRFQ